jgi:alpha-ketoglutarate-dependent taurine dioxygenase
MNKIYNLNSFINIKQLADSIKKQLLDDCDYIVIKNNSFLDSDDEIIDFYNKLNELLGSVIPVDKHKYNDPGQNDIWVDVKYSYTESLNRCRPGVIPPWKTNDQLMLHTDNTLTNESNFANITELVCLQPSKYSGETVIISNNKIIELIKYLDNLYNSNLYNNLLNTKIYHKSVEKNICIQKENKYTFNFNITQILKSELNNKENLDVANDFSELLENIMKSSLLDEIKLERGDALLFNDTTVMHGRKYVFGERFYKKCSILIK